jgi:hypothetical protein
VTVTNFGCKSSVQDGKNGEIPGVTDEQTLVAQTVKNNHTFNRATSYQISSKAAHRH